MYNLIKIGKFFLGFLILVILFDAALLGYTYIQCSHAMDNTLENIALIVAEDNCIDTDSKLDSIKELMIKNAPIWLTYNDEGMGGVGQDARFSSKPTNLIRTDLEQAKRNIDISTTSSGSNDFLALKLSSSKDGDNEPKYYSYTSCPNRGTSITVTLSAKVNVYILTPWGVLSQQSIPISKQITVVGMKFYKGKGEADLAYDGI